ncbi:hypothetical protein ABPG74_011270 [Tetrahymena malaccensis]
MKARNNIRFQVLEARYINSAVECLNEARNQPGSSNKGLGVTELNYSSEDSIFSYFPRSQLTTIVAIDTSKTDYVCGIYPSLDLPDYEKYLKLKTQDLLLGEKNKISLKIMEPLFALNQQNGKILMVLNIGVRQEYENQKIAQNLQSLFLDNAQRLGYLIAGGIASNPTTIHIFMKNGFQVLHSIDLSECDLPDKMKKTQHKNVFLFGKFLFKKNLALNQNHQFTQQPSL